MSKPTCWCWQFQPVMPGWSRMVDDDHNFEWWGEDWRLCPLCGEKATFDKGPLFEGDHDEKA